MNNTDCRITEIFYSLQGETSSIGWPTVFVRLTGCPLRCVYCDTAYAFSGGQRMSQADILATVHKHPAAYVTVTGGEPLAQPGCLPLLTALCDRYPSYQVSLETSGALSIAAVDSRVRVILDLKTPASAEVERNDWDNLTYLKPQDEIKFVICDRQDYQWACRQLSEHQLTDKCAVLFSPSYQQLSERALADWILADGLPVRLQIQLHKLLWADQPGR